MLNPCWIHCWSAIWVALFTRADQIQVPAEDYLGACQTLRSLFHQHSGGLHVLTTKIDLRSLNFWTLSWTTGRLKIKVWGTSGSNEPILCASCMYHEHYAGVRVWPVEGVALYHTVNVKTEKFVSSCSSIILFMPSSPLWIAYQQFFWFLIFFQTIYFNGFFSGFALSSYPGRIWISLNVSYTFVFMVPSCGGKCLHVRCGWETRIIILFVFFSTIYIYSFLHFFFLWVMSKICIKYSECTLKKGT